MLEMREIEAFLAVAEELHFGRAAERLRLSTSRVSKHIRAVERRVGTQLFERSTRVVRLTPPGAQLYTELRTAYIHIERALDAVRRFAGLGGGVLRAGFASTLPGKLREELTTGFEEHHPGCRVVSSSVPTTDLFRWLGKEWPVDVFVTWMPADGVPEEPTLRIGPVIHRKTRAVMLGTGHPLAGRPSVDIEADVLQLVAEGGPRASDVRLAAHRLRALRRDRRTAHRPAADAGPRGLDGRPLRPPRRRVREARGLGPQAPLTVAPGATIVPQFAVDAGQMVREAGSMTEIKRFQIDIPQAELDDLLDRLARTRWTNELPPDEKATQSGPVPPGWERGVPLSYVQELVGRWRTGFDWRAQEARLNKYPQYTTEIDGQTIHFVHVRSAHADATPLILTHGWPNTFVEYTGLIDELTDPAAHGGDPADAFHVVIPSIPGFGFSGPTTEAGWNRHRIAAAWGELMSRLGYERYGVHGNDAGAFVAPEQGRQFPDAVIGVHVNQLFSFPDGTPGEFDGLSEQDVELLGFLQAFNDEMSGFAELQSTKPQNLAHALADSPAGQLAWIGQLLGTAVDPDTVLTIASIYWFTNTAASSARLYYEDRHTEHPTTPTTAPTALAAFAYDFRPVRKFAERDHGNLVSWTEFDRGSHWAAHDAPDLLVTDLRRFFGTLRPGV
jgi:DNA-binding transcriptional LysR family regulator/pimeloyl-ACP methyl ester carboxylesterase